jgi:hypothetical protein
MGRGKITNPLKVLPADAPAKKKPLGAVDINKKVLDTYGQLPLLPSPLPKEHKDFLHCMPPEPPTYRKFTVFTAGSIEMGAAVLWQNHMATLLSPLPITVCNPRRGHWDPDIIPGAKDASFKAQVEWELGALEQADVICFFFDLNTQSPVTLLELGLWAGVDKVVVCCDERFWRQGNVNIVCKHYGIPFVTTFAELVPEIEKMLKEKGMELDDNGDLMGENVHIQKEKPQKRLQLEMGNPKPKLKPKKRLRQLEAERERENLKAERENLEAQRQNLKVEKQNLDAAKQNLGVLLEALLKKLRI